MSQCRKNGCVYIALYDFKAEHSETLGLLKDEKLLMLNDCLGEPTDGNSTSPWCLVQNVKGDIGYTPTQYLKQVEVSIAEELDFIEGCIEAIHIQATSAGGKYSSQQHSSLQKLVGVRSDILDGKVNTQDKAGFTKRKAPPPPVRSSSTVEVKTTSSKNKLKNLMSDENLSYTINGTNSGEADCQNRAVIAEDVPEDIGLWIVEIIRTETGGSHQSCVSATKKIVKLLASSVPTLDIICDKMFDSISHTASESQKLESEDGKKMKNLFEKLEELKEGGHELNWNIHNDEGITIQHISQLCSILSEADPEVSQSLLKRNGYTVVASLVTYYRMEHKNQIREKLLELFQCFCFIDTKVVSILVTSILPLEISREILACHDEKKLRDLGNLMMVLFSTGEDIPVHHYEYLNVDFINAILDITDKYDDSEDQTTDAFVAFLLAFNLHFQANDENIVIESLIKREAAKSFTEKIMLLINREDEPVISLEENSTRVNSVIKLVSDMFQSDVCSQLFYTNDVKVLIDIVLRQISDLGSADKMRNIYLELLSKILHNSCYHEHKHHLEDIQLIINRIINEEDCGKDDLHICNHLKQYLTTIV